MKNLMLVFAFVIASVSFDFANAQKEIPKDVLECANVLKPHLIAYFRCSTRVGAQNLADADELCEKENRAGEVAAQRCAAGFGGLNAEQHYALEELFKSWMQ